MQRLQAVLIISEAGCLSTYSKLRTQDCSSFLAIVECHSKAYIAFVMLLDIFFSMPLLECVNGKSGLGVVGRKGG